MHFVSSKLLEGCSHKGEYMSHVIWPNICTQPFCKIQEGTWKPRKQALQGSSFQGPFLPSDNKTDWNVLDVKDNFWDPKGPNDIIPSSSDFQTPELESGPFFEAATHFNSRYAKVANVAHRHHIPQVQTNGQTCFPSLFTIPASCQANYPRTALPHETLNFMISKFFASCHWSPVACFREKQFTHQ